MLVDVSVDNRVDMYPLMESGGVYQVNEKDNIFIFGINNIFKLKLRNDQRQVYLGRPNLDDWVSYVLHAGICLLNTKKPYANLKIGIGLKDFYQNHAEYANFVALKKVRYVFNGNLQSKSIKIRHFNIYPNLYGHARWIASARGLNNFVVIGFGLDSFEGVFFENDKNCLSQRYVLGAGFKEFLKIQESASYFEAESLFEKLGESSAKLHENFDAFYASFLKKKVEFICRKPNNLSIFYVEGGDVSRVFHEWVLEKLRMFGKVHQAVEASTETAYGLSSILNSRKSKLADDVAVSIFPDHSTFALREEETINK